MENKLNLNEIQTQAGLDPLPTDIGTIISTIIPYVFSAAGIALLTYLISGGFKLMLSGGDPKKIQEGKSTITNALIGFVVVFFAYWIVQIVGLVLNIEGVGEIFK